MICKCHLIGAIQGQQHDKNVRIVKVEELLHTIFTRISTARTKTPVMNVTIHDLCCENMVTESEVAIDAAHQHR